MENTLGSDFISQYRFAFGKVTLLRFVRTSSVDP